MLEVDNLTIDFRRYAGVVAQDRLTCLRGISLRINPGEVLAVVGASGAGKSLLAQALLGILPANAEVGGSIIFQGKSINGDTFAKLRGRAIALVPQSIACLDPLARVRHQIQLAARRAGMPTFQLESIAERALGRFGLDPAVGRAFPPQLSGGMARRVLLAMATVGNPTLIVADEPTTGLDGENATMVLHHLRMLADSNKGVLLISHDLRSVLPMTDRVAVMRDGAMMETAPAARFRDDGAELLTSYARALWRALPENDFFRAADIPLEDA